MPVKSPHEPRRSQILAALEDQDTTVVLERSAGQHDDPQHGSAASCDPWCAAPAHQTGRRDRDRCRAGARLSAPRIREDRGSVAPITSSSRTPTVSTISLRCPTTSRTCWRSRNWPASKCRGAPSTSACWCVRWRGSRRISSPSGSMAMDVGALTDPALDIP